MKKNNDLMICGSNQEFYPPFLINQIYIYKNIRVDIYILRLEIQMNIDYNINGESPENLNN